MAAHSLRQTRRSRQGRKSTIRRSLTWFLLSVSFSFCALDFPARVYAIRFRSGDYQGRGLWPTYPLNATTSNVPPQRPVASPRSLPASIGNAPASSSPSTANANSAGTANGNCSTCGSSAKTGGNSGNSSSNNVTATAVAPIAAPYKTPDDVLAKFGAVYETATDLSISADGMDWSLTRSYVNGAASTGGATTQGSNWINNATDKWLNFDGTSTYDVILDGATMRTFTTSGSSFIGPADGYSTLTYDAANNQYIFSDQINNLRWTFRDYSVDLDHTAGGLKEESTLQLFAQGKSGFQYTLLE